MLKKRYIYSLITCKSACAVHGICIVLVNWKLAKNRYCGSIFYVITTKKTITSIAVLV